MKILELGDWAVCRTTNGTIEGTVTKLNSKTFWVRLQIAGKYKFIKRKLNHLIDVIEF